MGVLLQTMAGKAIMNKMADIYWGSVSKQLNRFGLRYEDILVETPEVREALRRLSPEAKEGRSQRYRRAIDLSFKKHYSPETIQAKLDASKPYLNIKQVEREYAERIHWDRTNSKWSTSSSAAARPDLLPQSCFTGAIR